MEVGNRISGVLDKDADNQNISYDSMINLRPRQNRSMEILDANIRERVAQIIMEFLGEI